MSVAPTREGALVGAIESSPLIDAAVGRSTEGRRRSEGPLSLRWSATAGTSRACPPLTPSLHTQPGRTTARDGYLSAWRGDREQGLCARESGPSPARRPLAASACSRHKSLRGGARVGRLSVPIPMDRTSPRDVFPERHPGP